MRRTEKSGQEVIRVMIVRGKLGGETLEDEKEKEIQDMWNKVAEKTSVKKSHETQFLMLGDILTVIIYLHLAICLG